LSRPRRSAGLRHPSFHPQRCVAERCKTANRKRIPKQECEEVRLEKMVAIAEQAHEGERQSDGAHHKALRCMRSNCGCRFSPGVTVASLWGRQSCCLPSSGWQTARLSAVQVAYSRTSLVPAVFRASVFLWRKFGHRNPLAQLQRPDIGNDAPAVIRDYSRGVARHRAEAVGHHIEKMPDRSIFEPLDMVRRRLAISSLDHETLPVP